MKRDEAVTFLKEISTACSNLSPNSVALVNSEYNDPLSIGFQVHIQTVLDTEDMKRIKNIAANHRLALKGDKEKIIIYQPKAATEIK